jgi:two-component system response regulator HydG
MVKAIEIINHAKETDGNVLITGEYGTGKNHIARAIHNKGNRKEKAFIFMNCRHLNSYFQNEKAFEENIKNYSYFQDEIFKKASGGTLFLEDIDMLSSNAQLSLLQKIYEIDELTKIKIQGNNRILRIVSTTCIPIKDLVLQGKFENELFHKIAEIYIELAPLKNRKEDIPLLVEHFMKEIALERGIEVPQISNLAMESLEKYTWPNNISELERILRKIISLKQKNESINLKDIPKEILEEVSLPKESTPDFLRIDSDSVLRSNVLEGGVSLARLLDQMEESFLEAAYRLAKGNKKSAAKLLSMHDKTFLHKFNKKFDLKNKLEPKK